MNEGEGGSGLLAIAEAPGEHEAEEGRPLSPNGASGKVFRRALRDLSIPANSLTITNILRSRPPDNELRGMPWEREAIDHCAQYLRSTIEQSKPKVLLALGDVPLRELVAERHGTVTVVRGFMQDSKYGIPLVATYHPSYIARGAWHLFGAFKADIAFAYRLATQGVVQIEREYELSPSIEDARRFLLRCAADSTIPISYDIETAHILGEKEPDDWRRKRIVQIQFSIAPGQAIVLPWEGEFRLIAFAILRLSNPKWGWNSRLSDDLALTADGAIINGELHDLMNAWGHVQPSFWGGKDDKDPDKGVPSRLMGLQSATSFYAPEVGLWKHLGTPEAIAADPSLLPLYGAYDADYTYRCGEGIMRELESLGLMHGYRSHKLDLRPVLDYLGEVGLPVDRTKQAELRAYVQTELQAIQSRIQAQVPSEILGLHPKAGYKALHSKVTIGSDPKGPKIKLSELVDEYDPNNPVLVTAAGHVGYLVQRDFDDLSNVDAPANVRRWCIERLYNPHGSSPNTKSYIRHMGYRMPTRIDDPTAETTGKNELKRLADETGDEVLRLTHEWRELAKTGLDYTAGAWVPGEDGRVHATFKWGTASAQLVAVAPAVMTYPEHAEIAKKAKAAIRAEPGHTLVKIDMRGFHARSIGWLANDPDYYKLADFDVHSFITAHFLHLHDAPYLREMDDDELRAALNAIKREHGPTRNYKVKRCVHGRQFNMGVGKLYNMYPQNFNPPEDRMPELIGDKWFDLPRDKQMEAIEREGRKEARTLFNLFDQLFPRVFLVYPSKVEEQLRNITPCRLCTPYGHHRMFYDYDKEQSTAYGPSNSAHCHIQAALVRLWRSGALRHFEMINFTHDAGWFHPENSLVEECIATVQHEFELPSTVLVDSPLGPFQCNSDAEVGYDLAHMDAWKG